MFARIQLIRPLNLLFIILGQCALLMHLIESNAAIQGFFLIFSTILSAAAGYVINDIFDIKADFVNRPTRPLVSGKISKTNAIVFYLTLLLSSLFIAYYAAIPGLLAVVVFINIALFFYALFVKRTAIVGNLLVSVCVGMVFIVCNLLAETPSILASGIGIFATAANFIRENFKSIEDFAGDKIASFRTLPVLIGSKNAMIATGFISLVFGGILLYRAIYPITPEVSTIAWALIAIIGGSAFFLIGIMALRNPDIVTAKKLSLITKFVMLIVIMLIFLL